LAAYTDARIAPALKASVHVALTGEEKAKFHWTKVALLAIVAGMYCGFGFTLCLIVGGNAPKSWLEESPGLFSLLFGAVGFPFSFTLVSTAPLHLRLTALLPC
jgi:formate/nitrite transporter FocA (FNT family)